MYFVKIFLDFCTLLRYTAFMKINNPKIYNHLINRGFISRVGYNGKAAIYFGMDNIPWVVDFYLSNNLNYWCPSLACYKAKDWIIVDDFWDGMRTDFRKVEKKLRKALASS